MEIYIGDQPVSLLVAPERHSKVKELEKEMNSLYKRWRQAYPRKTDIELTAMIAYQYASYYQELTERYVEAARLAKECNGALDSINF